MIQRVPISFAVQENEYKAKQLSREICKNWYIIVDGEAKFKSPLIPFPGSELFSEDTTSKSVRGLYSLHGVLYAVVDDKFRIYSAAGGSIDKGTLKTSAGHVSFLANDTQIFISDIDHGYVYQVSDLGQRKAGDFFEIVDASSLIGSVTFVGSGINDLTTSGSYTGTADLTYKVEIDGVNPDTFRWSDSNGTTWNAINVAITGSAQDLNNGISITFQHTAGHTQRDFWTFPVTVDNAFYAPIVPTYLNTYGIYPKPETKRFYISAIDDFSQVNALDFAQTNKLPDNLVLGYALNDEIVFFCEHNIEFWQNTGASPFPFIPRPNLLLNYGCVAPFSVVSGENNILFWLAQSSTGGRFVMMMQNYEPMVISTDAINSKIQEFSEITDAFALFITWEGRNFYFLTFPTEDITFVYDLNLKRWYQRTTRYQPSGLSPNEYNEGRYLANCHTFYNGIHLIGDYKSGNIYKLSKDYYKDGDEPIICEAVTAPIHDNLARLSVYSLQLDFEMATAELTGDTTDPQAMLQYSHDGGYTWSKELWRSLGKTGEYRRRVKWNKLNCSRTTVYRIRISDPVYRVLMGAVAEMEDTKQ